MQRKKKRDKGKIKGLEQYASLCLADNNVRLLEEMLKK